MMQKTDGDVFVACCDECFDEIDFRGRWSDFQGFLKSEGWHIRGARTGARWWKHLPSLLEGETANDQNTHSR